MGASANADTVSARIRLRLRILTMVVLAGFISPAISAGADVPPPAIPVAPAGSKSPVTDLSAHEVHIAELERSGGAYNPQLAEALLGLGQAQRARGLYPQAAETLQRGLHIARANEGLHNLAHVPLLQALLEVHGRLGDAEAMDRDYQQLYWVRRRNAGSERAALLPVIEEIGQGRLRAYEAAPAAVALNHLVKADVLYDLARRLVGEKGDASGSAEPALYYHAAVVNHRLALEMKRHRVGFHDLRAAMIDNGREVFEVNEEQARESLFQKFFLEGEWLAREIVARTEANESAVPLAHAEALVFLGDYYLSFRRNVDAMQEYRRAMEVLRRHGLKEHEERLFGTPALVTGLRAPGDPGNNGLNESSRYVEAVVDVSDRGWPENVRVQRTQPENDADLARRGERAIHALHYRPRFADGEPVSSRDITALYVFLD